MTAQYYYTLISIPVMESNMALTAGPFHRWIDALGSQHELVDFIDV